MVNAQEDYSKYGGYIELLNAYRMIFHPIILFEFVM